MSLSKLLAQIKCDTSIWKSQFHGLSHWDRVLRNALIIGRSNGADLEVIPYFAYLHDCCRLNEDEDPLHGARAAAYAKRHRDLIDLSEDQFKILKTACAAHTHAHPERNQGVDPTLAACWDGDRLDLPRVGIKPHPRFLFSKLAQSVARGEINLLEGDLID